MDHTTQKRWRFYLSPGAASLEAVGAKGRDGGLDFAGEKESSRARFPVSAGGTKRGAETLGQRSYGRLFLLRYLASHPVSSLFPASSFHPFFPTFAHLGLFSLSLRLPLPGAQFQSNLCCPQDETPSGCPAPSAPSFSLAGDPTWPATLEANVTRPLLSRGPVEDYESLGHKDPRQVEKEYYRTLRNQRVLLASFAAVLGNFNFGFALVYTSPVIPALVKSPVPNLQLTQTTASWFGSIFTLGVAAGGLCTMYFNDRLGRKLSIMFSAVPSVIGYFFMASAYEIWMLLVGRLLTGFAGGVTSAAIPVYISEISHPGIRGALGSCPQIMAVLGALFLYALGLLVPWRWLAIAGEVPVLLMICLVFFMPDSPRFLISKGKEDEALGALQWLRGKDVDFWWEYEQIKASVQEQSQPISWTEIRKPYIVKPIVITLLMRFLQQLSGVTPILVYLQLIFDSTEVILAPQYDAVIVGGVRLASVLVAAFSMDKAGRKILLYVSACIMLASNLTLGLYIHFIPRFSHNCSAMVVNGTHEGLANSSMVGLTVIPLIATMFFIIGYAMGWGPITWLLMAEVLPLKARGVVSGLCVLVSWLTAFAVTKVFLLVKEKYGLEVPFFFFSTICVVSLVFTYLIPETKGKSLERIESYFRTGRRSFLESFRRHR